MPEPIPEAGIGFEGGENLFLKARYGEIDPVSYSLGKTRFSPEGLENRVVLLSGVNSVITSYSIHYTKLYDPEIYEIMIPEITNLPVSKLWILNLLS